MAGPTKDSGSFVRHCAQVDQELQTAQINFGRPRLGGSVFFYMRVAARVLPNVCAHSRCLHGAASFVAGVTACGVGSYPFGAAGVEVKRDNPRQIFLCTTPSPTSRVLGKIDTSTRVCLLAVISYQPRLVSRDTKFGPGEVCNAVIWQGDHDIRCGFWRQVAKFPAGASMVLYQVNVFQGEHRWEVAATESTEIHKCPQELEAELLGKTDIEAAWTSLTNSVRTDYDTVKTLLLSGRASVIQSRCLRQLDGVYEVQLGSRR